MAVKVAHTDDSCAGVQAYSPNVSIHTPCPFGGAFTHSAADTSKTERARRSIEYKDVDLDDNRYTDSVPDLGEMFTPKDGGYGYHSKDTVEAWAYRNLMMAVISYAQEDFRCLITMNDTVSNGELGGSYDYREGYGGGWVSLRSV